MSSKNAFFSYQDFDNAFTHLSRTAIGSRGRSIVDRHLTTLLSYGKSINASKLQIKNCKDLGRGYDDLVVVLLEPSDSESDDSIQEILEYPIDNTLKYVDDALQEAFKGKRDLSNTIVMDIRPFRPACERKSEPAFVREDRDRIATKKFMGALNGLQPKVVLVCQCQTGGNFGLQSSMARSGTTRTWTMENGHETVIVDSFHPGSTMRETSETRGEASELLFLSTFMVAANQLAGRKIIGEGISKLREQATSEYRPQRAPYYNRYRRY